MICGLQPKVAQTKELRLHRQIRKQSKRRLQLSDQEIAQLIDRFSLFSVHSLSLKSEEEVLYETQFLKMIGVLGSYFIGKRMFETLLRFSGIKPGAPQQARFIRLLNFVDYTDLIYYGQQQEKDQISFLMLDLKGYGQIVY